MLSVPQSTHPWMPEACLMFTLQMGIQKRTSRSHNQPMLLYPVHSQTVQCLTEIKNHDVLHTQAVHFTHAHTDAQGNLSTVLLLKDVPWACSGYILALPLETGPKLRSLRVSPISPSFLKVKKVKYNVNIHM